MKKIYTSVFAFSLFLNSTTMAEKISIELSNSKLQTFVDAVSEVANLSVVWDKDAIAQKDKIISLYIRKPVEAEQLLKQVLSEHNLALVKEKDFYVIRVMDEYLHSFPADTITLVGRESFDYIVESLKQKLSPAGEMKVDKVGYSIYLKDYKDNINFIKQFLNSYSENMKKQSEQISKIKSEGGIIKREFQIPRKIYKQIEPILSETISPYGKYSYDDNKEILSVIDAKSNMANISSLISKNLNQMETLQIKTKCFYAKALEIQEVIQNIKENFLSEQGIVVYKSKETELSQIGQKTTAPESQQMTQEQQSQSTIGSSMITSLPKICITDKEDIIQKVATVFSEFLIDRPYQVMIEARIVQINSNEVKSLGIQWGGQLFGENSYVRGLNSTSPLSGVPYIVDFPSPQGGPLNGFSIGTVFGGLTNFVDLKISALERIGLSKVLSKPQIVTIDGEKAEISQGVQIPYSSIAASGGLSGTSVNFKEAVLKLSVTPRVTADKNIIMDVNIEQGIPDFGNLVQGNPPINRKTLNSKVVVKDGEVIVIGGILEKTQEKSRAGVPGLMRIPVIGGLFRNNLYQEKNTELLIFIAPKIIYQ